MNQAPGNLDKEWTGREPKQPGGGNWWLWMAVGVAVVLVGICVVAGIVLVWQFQNRTETSPPPTLALPATRTPTPETGETAPTITSSAPTGPTATAVTSGSAEASQLTSPPNIDGNLSEWADMPSYLSAFRVFRADGWDGTDDLTAVWQLGWDNNNLYIAAHITDNAHVQTQTGNQIYRGDSLEIQFDTRNDGSTSLSQDNFQIHLSPGNFGNLPPASYRFQGNNDGVWVDAPGQRITLTAQRTTTGYTLEAAIPWLDLAMAPAQGKVIGLALNADDNDTPGTAVQEVMMSNVSSRTLLNPTTWGTLTLK